ncbi:late competence protein ComER [Bacillus sp. SG-1]|nr:late competence protein ComER [Bacillus sp. SG-1]
MGPCSWIRKERDRNLLVAKSVPVGTDPRPLELDWPPRQRLFKKWKRPVSPDRQMFLSEKKVIFLLFAEDDPEGLGYVPVGT